MNELLFKVGYITGWLLGNSIIIVPIGILLYFLLKPKKEKVEKDV